MTTKPNEQKRPNSYLVVGLLAILIVSVIVITSWGASIWGIILIAALVYSFLEYINPKSVDSHTGYEEGEQ